MTIWEILAAIGGVVAILSPILLLLLMGLCRVSGSQAQHEEDAYGMEGRRS